MCVDIVLFLTVGYWPRLREAKSCLHNDAESNYWKERAASYYSSSHRDSWSFTWVPHQKARCIPHDLKVNCVFTCLVIFLILHSLIVPGLLSQYSHASCITCAELFRNMVFKTHGRSPLFYLVFSGAGHCSFLLAFTRQCIHHSPVVSSMAPIEMTSKMTEWNIFLIERSITRWPILVPRLRFYSKLRAEK